MTEIPLYKVFMPQGLEDNLIEILYSGKISFGFYACKFENALKDYIGSNHLITTSNNTYASLIALSCCGIKPGDEIIASPMACLASNQPAMNFGAKIVWCDIDPQTGTLDPEALRKKLTPNTKVILHYHWCGYPGYIDEVNKIGKENGIIVIDDAIEAFGAEYKGKKLGNVGTDITLFSFQSVRLPNSIDGGAITFQDEKLYQKALLMRDFGINRSTFRDNLNEINAASDINLPGYNAMMSEVNGFIGFSQMPHVSGLIESQRKNALAWDKKFELSLEYRPLAKRHETNPNYWLYSLFTDVADSKLSFFRGNGFYASKVHLRNDHYSCFGHFQTELKGVAKFAKQQFSIPSGWWVEPFLINKFPLYA